MSSQKRTLKQLNILVKTGKKTNKSKQEIYDMLVPILELFEEGTVEKLNELIESNYNDEKL